MIFCDNSDPTRFDKLLSIEIKTGNMKKIWVLLLGIGLLTSCSDDIAISETQIEECDRIYGWDEIGNFFDCIKLDKVDEAKSILIGEWKLRAWDCGFCDPNQVDTPFVDVVLLDDWTGTSSYYGHTSEDFTFTWSLINTTSSGVQIVTDPPVWHITLV